MASQKRGPTLLGLPDRFVAAEIEAEAPPAFDAAQYSFFGDLSAAESGLEGALEDGLEAPPPEEGLTSQEYGLHGGEEESLALLEEEDFSVASIFRNQLGLGPAKTPARRVDPDDDAGLDALLTDPLSVARKQLRDDDYDNRDLPSELFPESVSSTAVTQAPSLFVTTSSYGLFDGYGPMLGYGCADGTPGGASSASMTPPPPQPLLSSSLQQPSPPTTAGSSLLQMLKKPSRPAVKAMTLEELEARMFGSAEATSAAAVPAAAGAPAAPGAALSDVSGGCLSGSEAVEPEALAVVGPNQQHPHSAALLARPLPGMPVSNAGARGSAVSQGGPRLVGPAAAAPLPPSAFPSARSQPGAPHGLAPQPSQSTQSPQPSHHPPMHDAAASLHGPMQMHMLQPQAQLQPPGATAAGLYPQPPNLVIGGGHVGAGPQPPNLMYNGNGMLPPPPPPHHHHHAPPGPGVLPPGTVPPPPQYGPAALYNPRGSMQLYGTGQMGVGGAPPFMHDGYPMRPLGGPPGMPGPMHGMPPRPGPFGHGHPALGPGLGTVQHQLQLSGAGPQRPSMLVGPMLAPSSSGTQRQVPMSLGPGGAPGPRTSQPRQAAAASDFGQQFARANGVPAALGAGPLALRPCGRLGGKWMLPDDVEYVVRSMLYTVANGAPYVEDYYYQAFVHKHVVGPLRQQLSPGAFPIAAPFVPESLRKLSDDQMSMMRLDPSTRAKFVEGLQGLGKIVLSNIRTPKVLMDLTDAGFKGQDEASVRTASVVVACGEGSIDVAKGPDQSVRSTRPLEQEPFLAARIMIEDCMNLLLDVDDIDRLASHMAPALAQVQQQQRTPAMASALLSIPAVPAGGPQPAHAMQLRQRRELLLAGINGAFRVPNSPRGAAAAAGEADAEGSMDLDTCGSGSGLRVAGGSLGDGVLIRILTLSKGRGVVARALLAIAPPASLAVAMAAPKPAAPLSTRQPQQMSAAKAAAAAAADGSDSAPGLERWAQGSDASAQSAAGEATPQEDVQAAGGDPLCTEVPGPYVLLWATLRNAWVIFGSSSQQSLDSASERAFLDATTRLAAALQEALLRLPTQRNVVDAAAAFNAGCQQHIAALCQGNPAMAASMEVTLLPLAQTRVTELLPPPSAAAAVVPPAWLGEALAALVTRASQLGLAEGARLAADDADEEEAPTGGSSRRALAEDWRREYGLLHERVSRHLAALGGIYTMAAASGNTEALAVVHALSCSALVNVMLQHASPAQAQELKVAVLPQAV